jgi:hypothetical protein
VIENASRAMPGVVGPATVELPIRELVERSGKTGHRV